MSKDLSMEAGRPATPDSQDFDLELRPKWGFRLVAPVVAVVSIWYAAADPSWQVILGAVGASAVSAVSWYGRVVVLEPTIFWRTFPNRWRSLDLSELREVDAFWGGKEPHLELWITGKDGTLFTIERLFWHRDWRILFGYVAKWAERAEAIDPEFKIKDRSLRRLGPFRHLVG